MQLSLERGKICLYYYSFLHPSFMLSTGGGKAGKMCPFKELIVWLRWQIILLQYDTLIAQSVKNLPVMQETQFRSLSQEDPLEK